jgi:predicted transcriptional regulator
MERPGVSFSQLLRLLDLNEGTLRYHLTYLERQERIRSVKEGGNRVYYSFIVPRGKAPYIGSFSVGQRRVMNTLRRFPRIGANEIRAHTNLTTATLTSILRKLKKERIIWEVETVDGVGYELITRERLLEEMLLDVVERFLKKKIDQATFLQFKEWIEAEQRRGQE